MYKILLNIHKLVLNHHILNVPPIAITGILKELEVLNHHILNVPPIYL